MTAARAMCRCGHPADMHEHYRRGTDCGSCGIEHCPAYAPGDFTAAQQTVLAALSEFAVPTPMPDDEARPPIADT